MKSAKILIADDHTEFRKVVLAYLRCLPNVTVVGEAEDGIDAIKKAETLNPDVIFMDISMPKCNGLDATRIIKSRQPHMKVVIVTSHDHPFYHLEAEKARADGFILKSTFKASLQGAIDRGILSLMNMAASVVDTRENNSTANQVLEEKA